MHGDPADHFRVGGARVPAIRSRSRLGGRLAPEEPSKCPDAQSTGGAPCRVTCVKCLRHNINMLIQAVMQFLTHSESVRHDSVRQLNLSQLTHLSHEGMAPK